MIGGFLQGLTIGLLAGIPLGPASASIVDTALRRSLPRALAMGFGAALVDFAYCLGAATGFGALLQDRPGIASALRIVGGGVLVALGILMMVRRPPDPMRVPIHRPVRASSLLAAAGTGIVISGLNPALMATWLVLAGTVLAGLSVTEALVVSLGVFLGTLAWFVAIALAAHRGRASLGARAVWITRVAGGLLVAYGLFLLVEPVLSRLLEP
jgi:threonine/homoserine/homoserine lactone efflux protein